MEDEFDPQDSSAHVGVTSLLGLGWAALCIISRYNAEVGYGGRFAFLYSVAGQMVSGFSDILTLKIEEGELECSLSPTSILSLLPSGETRTEE